MSAQPTNYLDIIERLPEGARLRLQNVAWDEYEQLLNLMDVHPGHRMSYDRGNISHHQPIIRARKRQGNCSLDGLGTLRRGRHTLRVARLNDFQEQVVGARRRT